MSARVLCGSASAWGAKRCSVIMQHLRSQGGGAAEPEVRARTTSEMKGTKVQTPGASAVAGAWAVLVSQASRIFPRAHAR